MSAAEDLGALFDLAQARLPDAARVAICGGIRGKLYARHRQLFGLLPVQLVSDDAWTPAELRNALPHEERLILAVRAGHVSPLRIPRLQWGAVPGLPAPGQEARLRGWRAVWGPQVVELLALPPRGSREGLRELRGGCEALGDPWGELPDEEPNETPIPIARDVAGWLRRAMRGAVLPLGHATTQAAYLRRLVAPLLAEDLAHGEQLERMLRLPERTPLPPVTVRI